MQWLAQDLKEVYDADGLYLEEDIAGIVYKRFQRVGIKGMDAFCEELQMLLRLRKAKRVMEQLLLQRKLEEAVFVGLVYQTIWDGELLMQKTKKDIVHGKVQDKRLARTGGFWRQSNRLTKKLRKMIQHLHPGQGILFTKSFEEMMTTLQEADPAFDYSEFHGMLKKKRFHFLSYFK